MLIYLTPNDFLVSQQNELCVKMQGFTFVFYTSDTCKYCKDVLPFFTQLSSALQGCVFGLMNVDQDGQKIVAMSSTTRNKLQYVPYIMLYINGNPKAQYFPDERNPETNFDKMKQFLITQTTGADNKNVNQHQEEKPISQYSIGMAKNKKRICYLNYNVAYAK